jgi:signal transduction histidine kinase
MNDIVRYFQWATDTTGFTPRWQGGAWSAAQGWLHIGSDLAICLANVLMAAALARFVRRRPGARKSAIVLLLGPLLLASASAYLLDATMFWWPAYRLWTVAKGITAVLSLGVGVVVWPLIPKLLALRDPSDLQREIAQRRRTELELRQVHTQLEGVIEERTAELATKNEEMEQFLNTVSHDLKNPIVTCLGLIGMVRQDLQAGQTAETLDSVTRIERSVTRMRQLIEDLLNLSRIGRVRFELGEVSTLTMIRTIGEELSPRLKQAGVTLEIADNLPIVTADEHWLTEVFENLITNALKYGCDDPQPRIVVGSVAEEGEARIFVRDNGRGIDPAHHGQVFEPFRRLRSDKEGTGMGLAIVVRIVKMHGGRVWIDSLPGQGATFWVALPTSTGLKMETQRDAAGPVPAAA